jgi:RNA polymerase sigma-70 factor, ECF subfamily
MSAGDSAFSNALPPDSDLILKTQAGDPSAFDELILRYQKRLYSVIYHLVLNHEDTEEVLMDTLTRAYKNIGTFRAEAAFYTWVYRIACNQAINLLRKRKRRPAMVEVLGFEEENERTGRPELADAHASADACRQLNIKEIENKLNESMASLSDEHRTVVNLFDIQGLSHQEISAIMKCSEGTVRSRLHYAHKQLQKLLRHYL